jgi:hypothetical protein
MSKDITVEIIPLSLNILLNSWLCLANTFQSLKIYYPKSD